MRPALGRMAHTVLVLLGVSLSTFLVSRASGDPVTLLLPANAPEAPRAALRVQLGLDRPVLLQYASFLLHALGGDLGRSYVFNQDVTRLVLERLPATLLLAFAAFALALATAIPLGTLAAARGGAWTVLLRVLATAGLALPSFWLGLMLALVFAVGLGWLPIDGFGGVAHLVLPAVTLSLQSMARLGQLVEAGLGEVLGRDFIRTARSKGLGEGRVIWVHALRNVLVPVVTMAALELGDLISSAVVVEVVFAWPGIGRLAVQALRYRDVPLLQGTVLIAGASFATVNLLADLLCAAIDPRIARRRGPRSAAAELAA